MMPGALYLLILAIVLGQVAAEQSQVRWISPSAGDYYGPGDSIVGKWTASKAVISPSFKLCTGSAQSSIKARDDSSGRCGPKAYPTVQQDNGVYSVSLTAPNATDPEPYYLLMMDDFDSTFRSPSFTLSPTGSAPPPTAKASQSTSQEPLPDNAGNSQSPLAVDPNPKSPPSAPKQASEPSPLITVTSAPIPTIPANAAVPGKDTANLTATRTSPPTAAFAIPLVLIGIILLVAILIALRQNRILGVERKADIEKMHEALASQSTLSKIRQNNDIESQKSALPALGYGPVQAVPIPLFMPPMPEHLWNYKSQEARTQRRSRSPPPPRYTKSSSRSSFSRPPSVHSRSSSRSINTYLSYGQGSRPDHFSRSYSSRPASRISISSSSSRPVEIHYPSHSHSRSPSILSSSSRPDDYFESHSRSLPRPPSIASSRTRVCLPSVLDKVHGHYDSKPEGSTLRVPGTISRVQSEEGVTESVLDDYLLPSPSALSPGPPPCLVAAPQRVHMKDEREKEERLMNPYDAIEVSLRNARAS